MIALTLGVLLCCHAALSFPYPGPVPSAYPGPAPVPRPGPAAAPIPAPAPIANADPFYGGIGNLGGFGFPGYGGFGFVEEVITPPVVPPVLNTVDVFDIATLGVIPAPPIEYVYPAVGYEAFGLGGYENFGYEGLTYGGYGGYPYW